MKNLIAQINIGGLHGVGTLASPGSGSNAGTLFTKALTTVIGVMTAVAFIWFTFQLIMGAIQWITSGGDKAALEGARGRITQALVGIIILFSAFAIVKLVETFFNIHILTIDIGSLKIQ